MTPTPEQLRSLLAKRGLTQREGAALVEMTERNFRRYLQPGATRRLKQWQVNALLFGTA